MFLATDKTLINLQKYIVMNKKIKTLFYLLLLTFAFINCSDTRNDFLSKNEAKIFAESLVKKNLKFPNTAKFSNFGNINFRSIFIEDQLGFKVVGHVETKNNLGITFYQRYSVEIYKNETTGKLQSRYLSIQ